MKLSKISVLSLLVLNATCDAMRYDGRDSDTLHGDLLAQPAPVAAEVPLWTNFVSGVSALLPNPGPLSYFEASRGLTPDVYSGLLDVAKPAVLGVLARYTLDELNTLDLYLASQGSTAPSPAALLATARFCIHLGTTQRYFAPPENALNMAFWVGAYFVSESLGIFCTLKEAAPYPEHAASGTVTAETYSQLMDLDRVLLFDQLSQYNTYALESLGICLAGEGCTAERPVDFVARERADRERLARRLADQAVTDNDVTCPNFRSMFRALLRRFTHRDFEPVEA